VRRRWRWIVAAVVTVVALNVIATVIDALTGGPGGPRSSAYATSSQGLAAYAELLQRFGHRVRLENAFPSTGAPDSGTTLVLLDPNSVVGSQARTLTSFVRSGGRLVAGGSPPGGWISYVLKPPPRWSSSGPLEASPSGPGPETQGVHTVQSAGDGSFTSAGGGRPLAGSPGQVLALAAPQGSGEVIVLADASPLQNRLLDHADNARFGVDLAGPATRSVVFVESVHGYGQGQGLGALPSRWLWALGGLALAVLAWMVARGRRLGPPERPVPDLPPPRSAYVQAVAGTLMRTRDRRRAAEPVRQAARDLVARRAGLGPDAPPEALLAASRRLGLDEASVRALAEPPADDDAVVAVGRAYAALRDDAVPSR
jgi:hypothetical protein